MAKRPRQIGARRHTNRAKKTQPRNPSPPRLRRSPPDSGLAPGMQAISPYLAVANVAGSMDFLEKALGFSRGVVLPDPEGQVRYAEMRHGDSVVVLVQKGDATAPSAGVTGLYTYVADVDGALARAREAGAGVNEAEDKPWGDRVAIITDADGHRWVLATFKKLVPLEQA